MAVVGPSFGERQQERVWCPDCEVELVAGSLADHCQAQHGKYWIPQCMEPLATPYPRLYSVSFLRSARFIRCTVGDCEGQATTRTNLRIHFVHCHMLYMVAIMEEGNRPHPCCPACDMFVPWSVLNRRHPVTSFCAWGAESKIRNLAEEEARVGEMMAFWDY